MTPKKTSEDGLIAGGGASFLNQPHMCNPHKIPTTYSPIFINHLCMTVQLAM